MKDVFCPHCENKLSVEEPLNETQAIMKCDHCSKSFKITFDEKTFPVELQDVNWGAFTFIWLWPFFNGLKKWGVVLFLIAVLSVIYKPIIVISLSISMYLGFDGNRLAWKHKKWESIRHFKSVQQKWETAAIFYWFLILFIAIIACMLLIIEFL